MQTPVLETPDGVIFESTAMARYIARLRRDTELLGASFFESVRDSKHTPAKPKDSSSHSQLTTHNTLFFFQGQVDQWLDFCALEVETQSQIVMHQIWEIAELNGAVFNAAKAKLIKAVNVLEGHLLYNTYMVGNSVTLADIALVAALHYPLQHALPLGRVPSVLRWYQTCMAQPQFEHVLGSYNLHLSNLNKVLAPKFPKGQKGGNKGGKGQQQGGKKGKKGGQQPKKKAAQPPAPPKKKKDPKPFEGTPRPKKAIDSWKRIFAPVKAEPSSAMPKFWEWLDADEYVPVPVLCFALVCFARESVTLTTLSCPPLPYHQLLDLALRLPVQQRQHALSVHRQPGGRLCAAFGAGDQGGRLWPHPHP